MTDWEGVQVKRVSLDYFSGETTINRILDQQDNDFSITDIQMIRDDGDQFAWIFYYGVYPDDRKPDIKCEMTEPELESKIAELETKLKNLTRSEPKPQPQQPVNPSGTLPAGIQLQSLMENKQ